MKNIFIIISFFCTMSLFADSFTTKDIKLLDKINGDVLATVTKGTKVKVLKVENNKVLIKIEGWSYEEEPNDEIFFKSGVTVLLAKLNKKGIKNRKILQTKEDEYEEVWLENTIKGWVNKNQITNDFKSIWKKEKEFINLRCSACHEAPEPKKHFAGEFPSLIDSMASQAGLTKEDQIFVVNYLQKNNLYGE